MKNRIAIYFFFAVFILLSSCNSGSKKLRYEIISSAPIKLDIKYTNALKSENELGNFNGTQWTYDIEIVKNANGQPFTLSFDAIGTTSFSTTSRIYFGEEVVAEKISDCYKVSGGTDFVQHTSIFYYLPD